jgi:cell wall-associated NlpC family hydrolase
MDLPAVLRPVSRASKYALASSRVAMGALFGSSGGAKGAGGVTLRAAVIASAVFLAAGIAGSVSLSDGSEARPATYPAASENPEDLGGVEDRVLNESPKDPYHQVVDDSDARNFEAEGYRSRPVSKEAFGEGYAVAADEAGTASFEIKVPETRYYSVWARWPADGENAEAARMGIPSSDGTKWEEVDQSEDGGGWVRIGAYEMQEGQRAIRLESGGGKAVADAVMIVGDALVGEDGRTASVADPYDFAADAEDRSPYASEPLSKSSATTKAGGPTGADVVRIAKRHLGTRYGYNRCANNVREDCSCHTRLVYRPFGRKLPDSPVRQWRMDAGRKIQKKSNLRRGDLVLHDLNRDGLNDHYKDHVSIWAGRGNIVHASNYFGRVVVSEERYLGGFWGGKRFALR